MLKLGKIKQLRGKMKYIVLFVSTTSRDHCHRCVGIIVRSAYAI